MNNPSSVSTYTTSYDGDGQPVREATTTPAYNTSSYMIRSSVLGGRVLTRLDSVGAKQKTVFNVDGRLTAVQLSISGSNSVSWTHIDPLGLSEAGDTKPVYDALGNYIPWQHVPSGAPPNAYPPFSPNFGGLGSSFGSSGDKSCVLNGLPISCSDLAHQIDIGNVAREFLAGGVAHRQAVQPFGLGMFYVDDGATYTDHPGIHDGIDPETGERTDVASATLSTSSHYELFLLAVAPPQNPGVSHIATPCVAMSYRAQMLFDKAYWDTHSATATNGDWVAAFDQQFSELYVGQPVTNSLVATDLFLHPSRSTN